MKHKKLKRVIIGTAAGGVLAVGVIAFAKSSQIQSPQIVEEVYQSEFYGANELEKQDKYITTQIYEILNSLEENQEISELSKGNICSLALQRIQEYIANENIDTSNQENLKEIIQNITNQVLSEQQSQLENENNILASIKNEESEDNSTVQHTKQELNVENISSEEIATIKENLDAVISQIEETNTISQEELSKLKEQINLYIQGFEIAVNAMNKDITDKNNSLITDFNKIIDREIQDVINRCDMSAISQEQEQKISGIMDSIANTSVTIEGILADNKRLEGVVNEKVSDLETSIDGKVTSLETSVDGKLNTLETGVDGKLTSLENKFNAKIDSLTGQFNEFTTEVLNGKKNMALAISQAGVDTQIDADFDTMTENISKIYDKAYGAGKKASIKDMNLVLSTTTQSSTFTVDVTDYKYMYLYAQSWDDTFEGNPGSQTHVYVNGDLVQTFGVWGEYTEKNSPGNYFNGNIDISKYTGMCTIKIQFQWFGEIYKAYLHN